MPCHGAQLNGQSKVEIFATWPVPADAIAVHGVDKLGISFIYDFKYLIKATCLSALLGPSYTCHLRHKYLLQGSLVSHTPSNLCD